MPVLRKKTVLPCSSPTKASRSPSLSMSTSVGLANFPISVRPKFPDSRTKTGGPALPVLRKNWVMPLLLPTSASRSPSPSMSASVGLAKLPASVRPNGLTTGGPNCGSAAWSAFWLAGAWAALAGAPRKLALPGGSNAGRPMPTGMAKTSFVGALPGDIASGFDADSGVRLASRPACAGPAHASRHEGAAPEAAPPPRPSPSPSVVPRSAAASVSSRQAPILVGLPVGDMKGAASAPDVGFFMGSKLQGLVGCSACHRAARALRQACAGPVSLDVAAAVPSARSLAAMALAIVGSGCPGQV